MTEVAKAIERIRKFFRDRPLVNRTRFAKRAGVHRNSLHGLQNKDWNPTADTLDGCLRAIEAIEAEEAKAQRKPRPNKLVAAAAAA